MNVLTRTKPVISDAMQSDMTDFERSKFVNVPNILSNWMADRGGMAGKQVLDFGCGTGLTAAGVALGSGAHVTGVDINPEAAACDPFLTKHGFERPDTLTFAEIRPGQTIEGGPFDLIYSWSVFEHVNNRIYDSVLGDLYDRMRPGGLFFVQISPLFFSPEGSHLWAIGYKDWEHLHAQTSDVHGDIMKSDLPDTEKQHLIGMYDTLNRVTADDLIARFQRAGFKLVREQRNTVDKEPPSDLLRAYQRDALTTFQIVALFEKTGAG